MRPPGGGALQLCGSQLTRRIRAGHRTSDPHDNRGPALKSACRDVSEHRRPPAQPEGTVGEGSEIGKASFCQENKYINIFILLLLL